MADEVVPVQPVAPVAVVEAAPVAAAPVVEQVAPVVAPEPIVEAAPVVAEAPAAEARLTDQPTLFEKFDQKKAEDVAKEAVADKSVEPKVEGDKAAEVAKTEEVKKDGEPEKKAEPVVEAAKPEPIKFEYKLPENVTLPEAQQAEIDGILNDFHAAPTPESQQRLIDFHFARLTDALKDYDRQAHQTFADMRNEWTKEVMADREIGGNGHDTAMQAIAYVRDNFVSLEPRGSKEYDAAKEGFDKFLHYTGAGDNPWFLRFVHNVSTVLNEPRMTATSDIKPIVQNDNGGRAPIYRHPTSQRNGR